MRRSAARITPPQQATRKPQAAAVQTYVKGLSAGMSGLECTAVTYSAATDPCAVSVTLTYTWKPEGYFKPMTWTVTSTMPVTY